MKRVCVFVVLVFASSANAQHRIPLVSEDDLTALPLMYRHARDAAEILETELGNKIAKIAWDESTNTVFILASAQETRRAREILAKIDEPKFPRLFRAWTYKRDAVILLGVQSGVDAARNTLLLWDAVACELR